MAGSKAMEGDILQFFASSSGRRANVCQQYFMKHGTTTAPVTDIMNDLGYIGLGQTLVAPKTEFEANGTFTIHHPWIGNITYYVESGDPTGP